MNAPTPQPTPVRFDSDGDELVGDLCLPAGTPDPERLPAVVVTGSWTTVKEQMAGLYARRLAERGFAALAFDFRGFGESAGAPRDYESPARKAEDIHSAIGYLRSRAEIDPERVGAVAVCPSSGYTALNATHDERVRSLAISTTDQRAAMVGEFEYYLSPERGAIPQWPNRFAVMSWPEWLEFNPIRLAPEIAVPTLLVHSEDAAVPGGAKRFHRDLAGPADFLWTQGTQFDFYDQEPTVAKALDAAEAHLRRTLAAQPPRNATPDRPRRRSGRP